MRTPRPFLGIFALALLLPLLLLACGGSDEPANGPSSERATAGPEGRASSGQTTARAENGRRQTIAYAQGHRRADEAKSLDSKHPAAHSPPPDGADPARNGPGSPGRPLQCHRRPGLEKKQ